MPELETRSFEDMVEGVRAFLTIDLKRHALLAAGHHHACGCFDCACAKVLQERAELAR